jgi:hypothetical protein
LGMGLKLQELPTFIGQLSALQNLIWGHVWVCKNYLHVLANWMHSKAFICGDVQVYKKNLHLLTNWMHSKTLICPIVRICKNYLHLLANWMHSKTFIFKGVQS